MRTTLFTLLILVVLTTCLFNVHQCVRVLVNDDGTVQSESPYDTLKQLSQNSHDYLVTTRRLLHKFPELSWKETNTLEFIRQQVNQFVSESKAVQSKRITIVKHESEEDAENGGIWYDVNFEHLQESSAKRLLFRADMDALPIQEETGLEFASVNPGVSHACGHDGHTAMLLGVFRVLLSDDTDLSLFNNHARLLFQRAEENGEPSGGQMLVQKATDLLVGVDLAFSLHLLSTVPSGVFESRAGPLYGCADNFKVTVECSGGHVGYPSKGINAIRVIEQMLGSLSSIGSRYLPTYEPRSLEPSNIFAGTGAPNVMPARATFICNSRNQLTKREDREAFMDFIEGELRLIGQMFERQNQGPVNITFERSFGYPATVNTPEIYLSSTQLLQTLGHKTQQCFPNLGGEDFAYVLEKVPGVYYNLGAQVEHGEVVSHHTPKFNFNENVMWMGVHYFLALIHSEHN